jgi:hypothetical protein
MTQTETTKPNYGRKTLKKLGRDKRKAKMKTDKEFAKTVFAAKSKRSIDKKAAFKKKKSGKK